MSKKYIIELDEDPHNIRLMQLKNGGDGVPITEFKAVRPYKEPNLEQVKEEAYAEGYKEGMQLSIDDAKLKEEYKRGLADAWEAARKIMLEKEDGGFTFNELNDIFGSYSMTIIFRNNTAAEAIAKIKVGEEKRREKEREIKIADEVETENGTRACVINPCSHSSQILVLVNPSDDQQTSAWWDKTAIKKTGKTYSEFLSVLKAIKQKKEEEKK